MGGHSMSKKIFRRDFIKGFTAGFGALASVRSVAGVAADGPGAPAGSLKCDLSQYRPTPGLTAVAADNALTVTWDGDKGEQLRLRMALSKRAPTIQDLALRKQGKQWITLISNVTPEF